MKWQYWVAIGAGIFVITYIQRNKLMQLWDDAVTWKRIQSLHPAIRERAKQFIQAAAKQGIFLRITSGLRTFDEQADLYAQGRTAPGSIVTNAKPGSSYHNYGLAFDVVEIKDGKGLWDNPRWAQIGAMGKTFGFEWGGDWTSIKDLPHFQYPPGNNPSALLAQYNAGKVDSNGYLTTIA
jgi:peptidoglycan L-alanyl-D-glutamate endopeptidase CwlK